MNQHSTVRRVMIVFFCCTLLLVKNGLGQDHSSVLVIQEKNSAKPLTGVSLVSLNSRFRRMSDSTGRIVVPQFIIDKKERLQVSMVGYKQITINGRDLAGSHTLELQPEIKALEEVVVFSNSPIAKVRDIQMGSEVISVLEARKLPSFIGEVDIIKLLQLKPGVKNAGEGLAGFYVRGGGADQNLILLDNAPVYNPNHLLGLFSIFNVDAVREVKLYKAAYPAQYSGRLSSVLDVSMRPGSPDSFLVSGGIGFLSSRVSIETPIKKGRSSIIVSGRRTYFDLFTNAINNARKGDSAFDAIPAYFFSDMNIRADFKINEKNSLSATGYVGSDRFTSPPDPESSSRFNWGNRTASLNWKSGQRRSEITGTLFYSKYQYQLSNEFSFNNLVLRSMINTVGLKFIANAVTAGPLKWQAGFDGMLHKLTIGDFKSSSVLSSFNVGEKASGNEWGIFLNTSWEKGKTLALLAGARLSGFYTGNRVFLNPEPRLAARINIGENSALKASLTRMYQYLHLASLSAASLPTDMWYPSTSRTKPQFADQASIGWSKAFSNNTLFLSLEGYYKWMKNQVEFRDGADVFGNPRLENDFVFGKGSAYGFETYIEKKAGKTTGWLGYTLSWATRTFADINGGQSFRPRYDRRHDFSLVFIHILNKKFSLSGNWIYGSGAWITVPEARFVIQDHAGDRAPRITPLYSKRSNYQLAAVHRLDLSLVMALKSRKGTQDLTFSLYNAYSRRNSFYIQFRELHDKNGVVSAIEPRLISLFPVLPGVTYNFKF